MHKLKINILSPEKLIYSAECEKINLPAELGEIGILTNHINFVSSVMAGILSINNLKGVDDFFVKEGFCEINENVVNIYTEAALELKKIKPETIRDNLKALTEKLTNNITEHMRKKILKEIHDNNIMLAHLEKISIHNISL